MMKFRLSFMVASWIICGTIAGLVQAPKSIDAQNRPESEMEVKRTAFQRIRGQLESKRVPFDPEVLLEPTWREDIIRGVDAIPEMSQKRVLGEKVSGVQMAETLYLPETVKLTGDTLLLAKTIIFEGNNVLIKGNHNIYFMPLEMEGALGTKLESAMRDDLGRHAKPNALKMLRKFEPKLIRDDYSLTNRHERPYVQRMASNKSRPGNE